jgi:hypothetical protein
MLLGNHVHQLVPRIANVCTDVLQLTAVAESDQIKNRVHQHLKFTMHAGGVLQQRDSQRSLGVSV